jgi:CheY-like chemotaxis protein
MGLAIRSNAPHSNTFFLSPARERTAGAQRLGATRVLIADDDITLCDLMCGLLQREGFLVCSVSRGTDAVRVIEGNAVDVALLDVKMPDLDGISVLRRAKQTDPWIEIIIITGYADKDVGPQTLNDQVFAFIRKPFSDIWQIPATVRQAAEKRRMAILNANLARKVDRQKSLLRDKVSEVRCMRSLVRRLAQSLPPEAFFGCLLEVFLDSMNIEICSILVLRSCPSVLFVRSCHNLSNEILSGVKRIAIMEAERLAGRDVSAANFVIRCPDHDGGPSLNPERPEGDVQAHRSVALVGVAGKPLGVLSMFRVGDEDFSPETLRLFRALGRRTSQFLASDDLRALRGAHPRG